MKDNTTGLLDDKNIELWKELTYLLPITVIKEYRQDYEVESFGPLVTIRVPIQDVKPSSFAHELLHVFLDRENIGVWYWLQESIMPERLALFFLSNELINHISNILQHIKMLPLFLEMGYDREEFLVDYEDKKITSKELNYLKLSLRNNEAYNSNALDFYVGKFFAIAGCPNENFDYTQPLKDLQVMQPELYSILDSFIEKWKMYDIKKDDASAEELESILTGFVSSLVSWAKSVEIRN